MGLGVGAVGGVCGVGIVGGGTIGAVHAAALASSGPGLDGVRLVAVAEPDEARGRTLAERHGADWVATDGDLFARADVDVVVLATPSGLHADAATRAARAGKHVVVEKPMATRAEDADRMEAACQAAGVALAVIFQNRFVPDARRLKRAVEAGLFGRPVLGTAAVHWHRDRAYFAAGGWRGTWALDGGGALMNQGIHTVDLLGWVLGPVAAVAAETATLVHRIEAEDTAVAALRFASGALGVVQGTTAADRDHPARLEIVGTAGRATLEGGRLTVWEPEREVADEELLTEEDRAATAGWRPEEPFGAAHGRQLRAVFAALREGREPPVSGPEARVALDLILAVYGAARSGRRVELPPAGAT